MEKKYLIPLMDGGIKSIVDYSWCDEEGCPTCDWGSRYITQITLVMEGFDLEIDMSDMYYAPDFTDDDMMKLLFNNLESIKQMTQKEFIDFIKGEIINISKSEDYEYSPEFRKLEVL